jgi:hypothetical protein
MMCFGMMGLLSFALRPLPLPPPARPTAAGNKGGVGSARTIASAVLGVSPPIAPSTTLLSHHRIPTDFHPAQYVYCEKYCHFLVHKSYSSVEVY